MFGYALLLTSDDGGFVFACPPFAAFSSPEFPRFCLILGFLSIAIAVFIKHSTQNAHAMFVYYLLNDPFLHHLTQASIAP
ncbi:MAG: hypothetical protein M0R76_10990 [Proteobacteria bacterium]|nr:hypothetical protein [Pseudomonadota bacterium]